MAPPTLTRTRLTSTRLSLTEGQKSKVRLSHNSRQHDVKVQTVEVVMLSRVKQKLLLQKSDLWMKVIAGCFVVFFLPPTFISAGGSKVAL